MRLFDIGSIILESRNKEEFIAVEQHSAEGCQSMVVDNMQGGLVFAICRFTTDRECERNAHLSLQVANRN